MSWSPKVYIGELRPWPKSVCVMPDSICVGRGRTDEERYYFPERKARKVTVWSHDTDHATGHTECSDCKGSINPCAAFCEHCGARLEDA